VEIYIWQKEFVSRPWKISSDDISKELDAFVIKRIVINHHILAAQLIIPSTADKKKKKYKYIYKKKIML
jgi:hypothetical protein